VVGPSETARWDRAFVGRADQPTTHQYVQYLAPPVPEGSGPR
jgi:hypothetical protein